MNIFLRVLKIKSVLFVSMKSLNNSENPSSNPLQEACSSFQVATSDSLKSVFKKASRNFIIIFLFHKEA